MAEELIHHICRVDNVRRGQTQKGHARADVTLTVFGVDGLQEPATLETGIGPYQAWMIDHAEAMQQRGEQYTIGIEQNGQYWNIKAIEGLAEPADWKQKLQELGLVGGGPRGNGSAGGSGPAQGGGDRPSPINTRLQIIGALAKLGFKDEATWDNWCWKLEEYVYKGKRQPIASRPSS